MLQNSNGHRRARKQLSCATCRQSKLKCNREQPACDQCLKRNRGAQCTYATPTISKKSRPNLRGRIRHLESLVVELRDARESQLTISNGRDHQSSCDGTALCDSPKLHDGSDSHENGDKSVGASKSRSPQDINASGLLLGGQTETNYVGGSHWAAILNEVDLSLPCGGVPPLFCVRLTKRVYRLQRSKSALTMMMSLKGQKMLKLNRAMIHRISC